MPSPILATELFTRVAQEMRLRGYAKRTIKTYVSCLRQYVAWLGEGARPRTVGATVPRSFVVHLIEEENAGRARVDQHISALKLLYVELYGWPAKRLALPRPKRRGWLPAVPTRRQVLRLADGLENRKHRLAVLLLYASGVRVSELVGLAVSDVDLERCLLRVRGGKGGRDRLTVFSSSLTEELVWLSGGRPGTSPLFVGADGRKPWSVRSVQHVLERGRRQAGLEQRITPHSLRHAFATHLLEQGTDVRVIQSLMGHKKLDSTTRYTRMADPARFHVVSPL